MYQLLLSFLQLRSQIRHLIHRVNRELIILSNRPADKLLSFIKENYHSFDK